MTEGPILKTLLLMAGGMLFGFVAMSAFNAVDTYFVGQLGTTELAAMSFTFPVVMVLNSIALGLGVGLSSTVSRAIGSGDHHKVKRLTTDGLILAFLVVVVASLSGILTINPLFTLLGAKGEILDLIHDYMIVWYIGIPFVVIPMAGNNVIRATGDTMTPSLIMVFSVVINIILDPLLIFGLGPFPALGIAGAAIATVIARFCSFLFSLAILSFREKLISFEFPPWSERAANWKEIAFVGVPAALVQAINPVSLGVITRLLSRFGEKVVAGFGAASRLEMLVLIVPLALGVVMAPFAGQNWGAGKISRIKKGLEYSCIISLIWGALLFLVFLFWAQPIIRLFNPDPEFVEAGSGYLKIIGFSYGFLGIIHLSSQTFNALRKPLHAAGLNLIKAFVLNIPLAFLGAYLWQERGIFLSTFITNIFMGVLGILMLWNVLKQRERQPA